MYVCVCAGVHLNHTHAVQLLTHSADELDVIGSPLWLPPCTCACDASRSRSRSAPHTPADRIVYRCLRRRWPWGLIELCAGAIQACSGVYIYTYTYTCTCTRRASIARRNMTMHKCNTCEHTCKRKTPRQSITMARCGVATVRDGPGGSTRDQSTGAHAHTHTHTHTHTCTYRTAMGHTH